MPRQARGQGTLDGSTPRAVTGLDGAAISEGAGSYPVPSDGYGAVDGATDCGRGDPPWLAGLCGCPRTYEGGVTVMLWRLVAGPGSNSGVADRPVLRVDCLVAS